MITSNNPYILSKLLENNKEYLKLDLLVNWGIPYMQQFYPRELFDLLGGYSEKLKCEDATGLTLPKTCWYLSHHPA